MLPCSVRSNSPDATQMDAVASRQLPQRGTSGGQRANLPYIFFGQLSFSRRMAIFTAASISKRSSPCGPRWFITPPLELPPDGSAASFPRLAGHDLPDRLVSDLVVGCKSHDGGAWIRGVLLSYEPNCFMIKFHQPHASPVNHAISIVLLRSFALHTVGRNVQ